MVAHALVARTHSVRCLKLSEMMRRNISETFTPEKNLSLLPMSNSDARRLGRRSNRPAAACGVVALLLLVAGLLWRSRGESTPAITSVQTDLRVPAEATPRGRGDGDGPELRDIPRSTAPQPTAGESAESSREAARRAVEKRALAEASKKEEEAMEKYAASAPSEARPKVAVRETKPAPAGAEAAGADGRTDFEKYGRKAQPGCVDRNPAEECAAWSREGECTKNPGFMRAHCRKSCDLCGSAEGSEGSEGSEGRAPEKKFIEEVQSPAKAAAAAAAAAPCDDKSDNCRAWTKAGECERNRKFMHSECRRSCNLCVGPALPTGLFRNPSETRPVAEDSKPTAEQEAKLKRHMAALGTAGTAAPPKVPRGLEAPVAAATVKCTDSNARCPDWAKAGECPRNQAFMRSNCPLSCDLCGEDRFQKLATMA